jgi:MinD superfamily P-loop ATPase
MCTTWGVTRTVTIVDGASDVTIHVSREVHDADVALYVHSAHISDADAAALLALMRHVGSAAKVAQAR